MTDDVTRLFEARKQIGIVAEEIEDQDQVDDLARANAIIESIEGDLAGSSS